MKLFEYEAKEIAQQDGLLVPRGSVASTTQEAKEAFQNLNQPSMIKAQVLVAGRGKAGGIKPATNADEAFTIAKTLLSMTIKGEKVASVLVEQQLKIKHERYVSIVADRSCLILSCCS